MSKKESLVVVKDRNPIPLSGLEGVSVLLVSGDSGFTVEMSYALKAKKPVINYCWSMESFMDLPTMNSDLVIIASDAWGAHRLYGQRIVDKLSHGKKVLILTTEVEEGEKLFKNDPRVEIMSCYDRLEDRVTAILSEFNNG